MPLLLRTTILLPLLLVGLLFVACGESATDPPPEPAEKMPAAAEERDVEVEEAPTPAPAEVAEAPPTPIEAPTPVPDATPPEPAPAPPPKPTVPAEPTPLPAAEPPEAVEAASPEPAEEEFEFETLETRLRETKALGFFTKLELKNQIDDLLAKVRKHHEQGASDWRKQREAFDLLVLKVMTLLQDKEAELAAEISRARESLWAILADPVRFAELEST